MKDIEILAPAGSLQSLYASLAMGADAVYVGTTRFGARAFADNPAPEELERALTFAHLRGKKIYLTVNTLLNDRELEQELLPLLRPLYEAGLDACIVQDMGVLSLLHENFPDLPLHASTQMTLFSGEEAELLRPLGVTRYVPARELSIEEIREAREQTELEIEVFVHGALCYCYSGQCRMSEVIGGRSGNRGMCAQPCRLPWQLMDSRIGERGRKEGYFLNTKDICTLAYIPELAEAGIDSFKIEGRMKQMEYSAYTASVYRKYVDFYRERGKDAFHRLREDPDSELWRDYRRCQDLYNRGGFSDSYLFERDKRNMIDTEHGGHYGVLAGEVIRTGEGQATWLAGEEIHPQDVLQFRDGVGKKLYEYTSGSAAAAREQITANVGRKTTLRTGQKVYRTRNAALLQAVREKADRALAEKYPLEGVFAAERGKPARLTVAGRGVRVSAEGEIVSAAEKRPVTEEQIRTPLSQLGTTDYTWETLSVSIEPDSFLSLGGLKKLRRQAIALWEKEAAAAWRRQRPSGQGFPPEISRGEGHGDIPAAGGRETDGVGRVVSVSSLAQLRAALSAVRDEALFHLKLEDLPTDEWEEAAELLRGRRAALSLPQAFRGRARRSFEESWRERGSVFAKLPPEALVINSFASLVWAGHNFPSLRLYAEENLYRENRRAAAAYEQLFGLRPLPAREYGRIPVMVSEGCPAADAKYLPCGTAGRLQLVSPKGDKFTVVNHCKYCYNTIYTSEPVRRRGDGWHKRLDFTWEREDEVRKVIGEWNF